MTGVDLALLIRQFIREKEELPRGLAHPAFFTEGALPYQDPSSNSSIAALLVKFGAVQVSTASIYEVIISCINYNHDNVNYYFLL